MSQVKHSHFFSDVIDLFSFLPCCIVYNTVLAVVKRPSVRQTLELWQYERNLRLLPKPHERSIILFFHHKEWLVGDVLSEILGQSDPSAFENADFQSI